jgi:hypothetical protein
MEEDATAKNEKAAGDCPCDEGKVPDKHGRCVMPEVTFPAFIMSLNTSVLYHLGEIGDPATGKRQQDFDLARHGIDTLVLLEEKTRGNLEKDEEELLKNIIYDVKLRFVKAVKK